MPNCFLVRRKSKEECVLLLRPNSVEVRFCLKGRCCFMVHTHQTTKMKLLNPNPRSCVGFFVLSTILNLHEEVLCFHNKEGREAGSRRQLQHGAFWCMQCLFPDWLSWRAENCSTVLSVFSTQRIIHTCVTQCPFFFLTLLSFVPFFPAVDLIKAWRWTYAHMSLMGKTSLVRTRLPNKHEPGLIFCSSTCYRET